MKQKLRQDLDIGSNLRALRVKYGFSQPALVARLETYGVVLSRSYYSRIETGELNVHVSLLVALQDIYRCSYAAFFSGLKEELERKTENPID